MSAADRMTDQAAEYLVRSHDETPAQRQEREAWLAADPRHAREYVRLQRLSERVADLRDDPDIQALKAKQLAALDRARAVRRRWTWSAVVVLLAVGTAIALAFCSAA
jgi:transmembrane sensor